jgi:ribose/xylose/arabinose/galactoside ABC-type transport system permease subunit
MTTIATPHAGRRLWARTRPFRPVLTLLITILIVFSLTQPSFFTANNLRNAVTSVAVLWIIAMGATLVQLTGGIDLSSAAIAALAGIGLAKSLEAGLPGPAVIVVVVIFTAVVGAVTNGLLIGGLGLNVFVVTLASMTALTGVVNLWSDANTFFVADPAVRWLASGSLLGVPVPILLMVLTLGLFLFMQDRTYFGRDVFAVGGSMKAAKLSGIRTMRTQVVVYAIAGGMAGLAGVLAVGRIGAAAPQPDSSLPLIAIAAILLGGTTLSGGSGSVAGTALGVLFIGVLQNGLSISGVPTFWQQVLTGVILIVAVLGDRLGIIRRPRRRPAKQETLTGSGPEGVDARIQARGSGAALSSAGSAKKDA